MSDAILFAPETVCLLMGLVLFFCPVLGVRYRTTWLLALGAGVLILSASIWTLPMTGEPFFPGIYRVDFFSQLVKMALALGYLLVVAISRKPQTLQQTTWLEFPMFLLIATLGAMMMVSATELLTLYLAMELAAYPIYIVVALHRNPQVGGESSTKYMIQGMIASAVSLYGMSFLFGILGSTYFSDLSAHLGTALDQPLFWLGLLLTLSGFFFKLALFPFHFWAPDTYQAAPHQVVTYLATVSKVAAVAVLCRLVSLTVSGPWPQALVNIQPVLMWLSVIAMTLGNLAALAQRDLKRLLGYSTVAHAGYILIGLQTFAASGLTSALFYTLGYLGMSFVCFLVVCAVGDDQDLVTIDSLSGLHQRSPLLALTLLVGMFGLIGLPPTVGFIGKWFLFSAALERGQFFLVLVAAVNSVAALYYYLLVIRQAYLMDRQGEDAAPSSLLVRLAAVVSMALVVGMGTFPGRFWELSARAVAALFT